MICITIAKKQVLQGYNRCIPVQGYSEPNLHVVVLDFQYFQILQGLLSPLCILVILSNTLKQKNTRNHCFKQTRDRATNQWTDGHPLIEMQEGI